MRFSIIRVLTAITFIGVVAAVPTTTTDEIVLTVKTGTSCHIGDPAEDLKKQDMHNCLGEYRNGNDLISSPASIITNIYCTHFS
jgi:hypothetical protein